MKLSSFFLATRLSDIRRGRVNKNKRRDSGQAIMESLLLLGIISALWLGAIAVIKKNQFFETVFGQPWGRLANAIEFGVPLTDQKAAGTKHPTSYARHSSHTETQ